MEKELKELEREYDEMSRNLRDKETEFSKMISKMRKDLAKKRKDISKASETYFDKFLNKFVSIRNGETYMFVRTVRYGEPDILCSFEGTYFAGPPSPIDCQGLLNVFDFECGTFAHCTFFNKCVSIRGYDDVVEITKDEFVGKFRELTNKALEMMSKDYTF